MPGTPQDAMRCSEFEGLLTEALDGVLPGPEAQRFQEHRAACPICGTLFGEAETGRILLRSLDDVAPPAELVEQILAATSQPTSQAATGAARPWQRVRSWFAENSVGAWKSLTALAQPRFAMSFAMAFFSLAMLLNVTGLRATDVRRIDLRPSAFVRLYEQATGKLVRYYENIRIVYEIQTRVEELRQSASQPESPAQENKPQPTSPTGGLEQEHSPSSRDAWLQTLPSAQDSLSEQAMRARMVILPNRSAQERPHSDSPARSTI